MSARRFIRTGADNWAGARPTTDADRLRKHGRILPMEGPEGELPLWAGLALLLAACFVGGMIVAAWS